MANLLIGGIKSIGVILDGGTPKSLILIHPLMGIQEEEIGGGMVIEKHPGKKRVIGIRVNGCRLMWPITSKKK